MIDLFYADNMKTLVYWKAAPDYKIDLWTLITKNIILGIVIVLMQQKISQDGNWAISFL